MAPLVPGDSQSSKQTLHSSTKVSGCQEAQLSACHKNREEQRPASAKLTGWQMELPRSPHLPLLPQGPRTEHGPAATSPVGT